MSKLNPIIRPFHSYLVRRVNKIATENWSSKIERCLISVDAPYCVSNGVFGCKWCLHTMGNNFISVYIGSFGFTTPDHSMICTVRFGSRSVPGFIMETREKISCLQSVVFLTVVIVDKEIFSSSEMSHLHQGSEYSWVCSQP